MHNLRNSIKFTESGCISHQTIPKQWPRGDCLALVDSLQLLLGYLGCFTVSFSIYTSELAIRGISPLGLSDVGVDGTFKGPSMNTSIPGPKTKVK